MRGLLILVFCLLPRLAPAAVQFISGFEMTDTATTTAIDSIEWSETGTDTALYVQSTVVHDETNGGHVQSEWAVRADCANGVANVYTPAAFTPISTEGALSFHLYPKDAPGTTGSDCRRIAEFKDGASLLCNVELCGDNTLKLLQDASLIGTTDALLTNTCSTSDHLGCTTADDCPGAETCTSCTSGTGADCLWVGVELRQGPTTCELRLSGRLQLSDLGTTQMGAWTAANIGCLDTGTDTGELYFDDFALADESRIYHGVVVPIGWGDVGTDGGYRGETICQKDANCLSEDICEAGLDDWRNTVATPQLDSDTDDRVNCRNDGATADCTTGDFIQGLVINDIVADHARSDKIWHVQAVVAGTPNDTNTFLHELTIGVRDDGLDPGNELIHWGEPKPVQTTGEGSGTELLTGWVLEEDSPKPGFQWSTDTLGDLMVRYKLCSEAENNDVYRVSGIGGYIYQIFPDGGGPPRNLQDRDGDGLVTIYHIGDSILTGTASLSCSALVSGETKLCNIDASCSWAPFEDLPFPEACTTNASCQTCDGSRDLTPSSIGYPCTAQAECDDSTCNLTTNECVQNTNIPCDGASQAEADADCTGHGTCDTGATCDDVCPGGDAARPCTADTDCATGVSCGTEVAGLCDNVCPERSGWADFTGDWLDFDVMVSCGEGGDKSGIMAVTRFDEALDGQLDTQCGVAIGQTHTACTCTVPTVTTDCGSGGTCAAGLCTVGDADKIDCPGAANNCAAGRVCQAPLADAVFISMGANDKPGGVVLDAQCTDASSLVQSITSQGASQFCDRATTLLCSQTSDCTATHGADAICVGHRIGSIEEACIEDSGNWTCTARKSTGDPNACAVNGDCDDNICATTNRLCQCDDDDACPSGFTCDGSLCRKTCAIDGDCGTGGSCDTTGGANFCKGRCLWTCSADTCTTSADCPEFAYRVIPNADPGGVLPEHYTLRGECVGSVCKNCGITSFAEDVVASDTEWSYDYNFRGWHNYMLRAWRSVERQANALGAARPVVCYATPVCGPYTSRGEHGQDGLAGFLFHGDSYCGSNAAALMNDPRFTCVADVYGAWQAFTFEEKNDLHTDFIHTSKAGGAEIMEAFGLVAEGLNACATNWPGATARAQRYCLKGNGEYAGTCDLDSDCASNETCEIKPCYCTTDAECAGKYTAGADGTCNTGTNECEESGGGASVCTDAGDSCWVYG